MRLITDKDYRKEVFDCIKSCIKCVIHNIPTAIIITIAIFAFIGLTDAFADTAFFGFFKRVLNLQLLNHNNAFSIWMYSKLHQLYAMLHAYGIYPPGMIGAVIYVLASWLYTVLWVAIVFSLVKYLLDIADDTGFMTWFAIMCICASIAIADSATGLHLLPENIYKLMLAPYLGIMLLMRCFGAGPWSEEEQDTTPGLTHEKT